MPILDEHTLDFISHSPEQTLRLGARLGALLQAGDIVCLEGELGSGKTCLTQGIARGMGIGQQVTSPTFTLIAEYFLQSSAPPLYHIDLYRLSAPVEEALHLGLDEYLMGEGICVIEWADRIVPVLPSDRLWITLRHLEESKRGVVIQAQGPRYDEVVRAFRHEAFGV
ncbi:MAG: tRNA (adenosine(37)-N6)-threonylcarbamoyltransferase complex ATPase subunit type 1 TsaE [Anaerolineae bacterium]|jgi:tRNA threonylcarbamoyladenosine biosynthesis protein TsaE